MNKKEKALFEKAKKLIDDKRIEIIKYANENNSSHLELVKKDIFQLRKYIKGCILLKEQDIDNLLSNLVQYRISLSIPINNAKFVENKEFDKLKIIDDFAKDLDLKMSDDLRFALVTRLVNLRDDSLVQVLKKLEKSEKEIIEIQEKAYQFVKKYWHEKHKNLIDFIVQNNLLTPFYREIFIGVYNVGLAMSSWQSSWTAHIINKINKELIAKFEGNEEKIMKYLEDEKLLDLGHGGIVADRCYSALSKRE
jgi:hypothetical protein